MVSFWELSWPAGHHGAEGTWVGVAWAALGAVWKPRVHSLHTTGTQPPHLQLLRITRCQ